MPLPVYIHQLETSLPETAYKQSFACDMMQQNIGERDGIKRIIRSVYANSGIEKRHSVITDFGNSDEPPLFFDKKGIKLSSPDTRTRNDIYTREARFHFSDLAKKLIDRADGFEKNDITHIITVSCTGFFAPGPDYYVIRDLGLDGSIQRYHIGFMGCYAAFQGLKMAQSFCQNNPDAVVLVLCVELCTLHLQFSEDTDSIISASVFGDGGSGALVSARSPGGRPSLEMCSFHNDLTPDGENDMAWTIGNHGFMMKLSTYVPEIIRSNIRSVLKGVLDKTGINTDDITYWAIHPGGRAILDKVQNELNIRDEQIAASRTVLKQFGNMSSATILFVLKELAETPETPVLDKTVFAMAFGPGLTIETGAFRLHHS